MNEILANPAVQGAVAPFLVALAIGLIPGKRWSGFALGTAFALTVTLVIGWNFEALSSSRKLAIIGVMAAAIAVIAGDKLDDTRLRFGVAFAAGLSMLWVASGVLKQMNAADLVLPGAAIFAFTAVLVADPARPKEPRWTTGLAAAVVALCAGVLALFGASAVLALTAISMGAGAGALVLLQLLPFTSRRSSDAAAIHLPCAVVAAGVCVMSCLVGGVSWYAVLPLIAIPWLARSTGGLVHRFIRQETP